MGISCRGTETFCSKYKNTTYNKVYNTRQENGVILWLPAPCTRFLLGVTVLPYNQSVFLD